jgi:NDP-sugar pyrophosphorylase family protein
VTPRVRLADYIGAIGSSPLALFSDVEPWELTARAENIVAGLLTSVGAEFSLTDGVAVHATATVERGAVLKAPAMIGAHCFVAAGAYVRGGCWVDAHCTLGPGTELKSSFLFAGTKLAHFNFVGDSILGSGVNLEAGAIVANYRNEDRGRTIAIFLGECRLETGVRKFGAVIGDGARIGANAVIAPGAVLPPGAVVPRLGLVDQG